MANVTTPSDLMALLEIEFNEVTPTKVIGSMAADERQGNGFRTRKQAQSPEPDAMRETVSVDKPANRSTVARSGTGVPAGEAALGDDGPGDRRA